MDFLTTEFEVFHNFNASKQKGNTVSQHNIEVESEETKAEKHPFFWRSRMDESRRNCQAPYACCITCVLSSQTELRSSKDQPKQTYLEK